MNIGLSFVLASRMEGYLVDEARQPVPNVRIERTWEWGWNSRKGSQIATTDARGRFEFPKVTGRSLTAGVLIHQPDIQQSVVAQGAQGPVEIFALTKTDYKDNSEMNGRPLKIVCRIDMKPGRSAGDFWGTVVEVQ